MKMGLTEMQPHHVRFYEGFGRLAQAEAEKLAPAELFAIVGSIIGQMSVSQSLTVEEITEIITGNIKIGRDMMAEHMSTEGSA